MKLLLISVFLISLVCFMSIPDVFGVTYPINVPMGAAAGVGAGFSPDTIKIERGDIIKWAIFDRGIHSVTSNSGLFHSGPMEANKAGSSCFPNCKSFTYTFHDYGTYNYHCQFHSWMQGSVIVGGVGSNASVKDCTNVGCLYLDNQRFGVSEGRTVLVKIYGNVNDSRNNDFVFITIKEPSGKLTEHKIPVTSTGKFEYPLPISYDKRGMYGVIVKAAYNPSGSQLGSTWFEVVKTSAVSQPKDITPTSIILTTDSQRYIKGSTIGIAGQLVPYQKIYGSFEVTIKVSSPNGNVVNVAQTQPSSTGTFGSTVNTSNWKEYGTYEIKAQYENLIKSHHFTFEPGPSSTSKTSTFLKLESVDDVFEAKGSNSGVGVKFEGQLLTSDRNTHIMNAKINLIGNNNIFATLTTDDNGKFSTTRNFPVGTNYGVYAFYDGSNSLKFESHKSQTDSFRVVQQQSIQSPTPSSGSFDPTGVIILVVLAVIMVGIIAAVKRKKKTPIPPIPAGGGGRKRGRPQSQPSAPPSGDGPSLIGRKACPNCHWILQLPTNQNRTQTCTHCGWKTGDPIN